MLETAIPLPARAPSAKIAILCNYMWIAIGLAIINAPAIILSSVAFARGEHPWGMHPATSFILLIPTTISLIDVFARRFSGSFACWYAIGLVTLVGIENNSTYALLYGLLTGFVTIPIVLARAIYYANETENGLANACLMYDKLENNLHDPEQPNRCGIYMTAITFGLAVATIPLVIGCLNPSFAMSFMIGVTMHLLHDLIFTKITLATIIPLIAAGVFSTDNATFATSFCYLAVHIGLFAMIIGNHIEMLRMKMLRIEMLDLY